MDHAAVAAVLGIRTIVVAVVANDRRIVPTVVAPMPVSVGNRDAREQRDSQSRDAKSKHAERRSTRRATARRPARGVCARFEGENSVFDREPGRRSPDLLEARCRSPLDAHENMEAAAQVLREAHDVQRTADRGATMLATLQVTHEMLSYVRIR